VDGIGIALIALAIVVAIATVRTLRRPGRMPDRPRKRPDPADRPYRQAAHYRASGELPRWDP